jgi:aryl-alcohol dehydrogenase-like predicted oxidoreductase
MTDLGATDFALTRVGFGAWAIGGGDWAWGWGPQDDEDSIAAIRHAVDAGIGWIDTAAEYGYGHSEEVVGRALRDIPAAERPLVFTKCGLVWDPADRQKPSEQIGDPASIRREAEASLRRLGVERLDLLQMHWPAEDGSQVEDYWGALVELRAEGTIRAAGLSNHDVAALERAEAIGHVDVIQPPLSAIDRRAASDVIPWAHANGTGVIVYSPMQSGLLSGSFSAARAAALDAGDWRRTSPDFGERLEANLALAAALEPVAARHEVSVGAVAIAWTLAWPGVSAAIVGARRPEQVDGWLPAARLELTGEDLGEIEAAILATGAGEGPIRPTAVGAPR